MIKTINDFNEKLKNNIEGYIAMSITDIKSGEPIFFDTLDKNFDIKLSSACNLEVVKAKLRALDTLELEESIENITIHLNTQFHVIEITENKKFFIYVALDKSKTTIGLAKSLINKFKEDLNDQLNKGL